MLNGIPVQLLEGIIYVIKTQLHDYLEGTLTHLSPSIVPQAYIKDSKEGELLRRKIEKKLQCVAEKEVELSNEFPDISECKRNVILSVLSNVLLLMICILNTMVHGSSQCAIQWAYNMCKAIKEVSSS